MRTFTDAQWAALTERAATVGAEHGTAAAQWVNVDGLNAQWYVRGLADGDPAVLDSLPTVPMTGEWADDYGPADLYRDLEVTADDDGDDPDLVNAYVSAWIGALQAEVERRALYQLTDTATATAGSVS